MGLTTRSRPTGGGEAVQERTCSRRSVEGTTSAPAEPFRRPVTRSALYDIGIYCINAAACCSPPSRRACKRPSRLEAVLASRRWRRRRGERGGDGERHPAFPRRPLATFTCSFGAADVSAYRLVGTKGTPRMDAAYEYSQALRHAVVIGTRKRVRTFPKRVQFAPSCYTSHPASCTIASPSHRSARV